MGLGTFENEDKPCEIEVLSELHVTFIAAGGWHSAAVTMSGDLYMWGWNNSGQLGRPAFRRKRSANGRLEEPTSSSTLERRLSEKHKSRASVDKGTLVTIKRREDLFNNVLYLNICFCLLSSYFSYDAKVLLIMKDHS